MQQYGNGISFEPKKVLLSLIPPKYQTTSYWQKDKRTIHPQALIAHILEKQKIGLFLFTHLKKT